MGSWSFPLTRGFNGPSLFTPARPHLDTPVEHSCELKQPQYSLFPTIAAYQCLALMVIEVNTMTSYGGNSELWYAYWKGSW